MSQDGPGNGETRAPVPSAPTEAMPDGLLAPGQVLGDRYQIKSQLGKGGMGEVWRAFDLKLRVEVALKALLPSLFQDEKRRDLLRSEVRAAREVVSPNVCRIFDLIEVDGRELVSMEYVDGLTLLDLLRDRGPLDLEEAQDIASQFLAGLEAIHQAGLVHRDVKPENIMITRAGRVVLMDFGLARQQDSGAGTVAGTPAYMAPEQAAGLKVDARADVYSAGVVLAEMVSPDGIKDFESRQSVWEGIRQEPAQVPDTPWGPVLKKAVAKEPEQRHNSAHTLIRELEDVTLRVEGAEDLTPYPGLASFTEDDAEYFFGREGEIEAMWLKLGRPQLIAIVGPSGAGKSSFIRAGVLPAAPPGWGFLVSVPGNAAISSLARVMARELAGDADAVEQLLAFDDLDVAVDVVARWRRRHSQALLVVDQFEELFTLNTAEEQSRFATLLARLVIEADVCVMLSMRDDFLMRCRDLPSLQPIFSDLTALPTLGGSTLRRALVQPAMKCGYRFEDDELVEEMLAEVEGGRGALPMLAFAMVKLWEQRDRDDGLLTRRAYHDIGGVGGALAKHAESTIDRIGAERLPIVRELFRNLVTAEGTRAVREWDELLSIFSDSQRESSEEVLRHLIDARLLTSYETQEGDGAPTRQVEIIHESLLANWPRLVGWQNQDADSARLRSELRQAARIWDEHDRHDDRLWTGTAFREYQLWRERYPGGLTETEEAFATAMTSLATRRRRRRRLAVSASFAILLAVLATVTGLWRNSVLQTRRAEAQRLLAMAREDFDRSGRSHQALAYAVASLSLEDSRPGRDLAMRHALRSPLPFVTDFALTVEFSPDGQWLAGSDPMGATVKLWPPGGGEPHSWQAYEVAAEETFPFVVKFTPDSKAVMTYRWREPAVKYWSVPDGHFLGLVDKEPDQFANLAGARTAVNMLRIVRGDDGDWALDRRGAKRLQQINPQLELPADLSPDGTILAYGDGPGLYVEHLGSEPGEGPRLVGTTERPIQVVEFGPDGRRLATRDADDNVLVWSLEDGATPPPQPRRGFKRKGATADQLLFDPSGSLLVALNPPHVLVSDLLGPPEAEAFSLRMQNPTHAAFHPDGRWLAVTTAQGVFVWPVDRGRLPMVLRGHSQWSGYCAFAPDGRWMVSPSADGTVRWWPLAPSAGRASRVLPIEPFGAGMQCPSVAVNATHIALAWGGEAVRLVPVDGGPVVDLRASDGPFEDVAIDPEGRYVAAAQMGSTSTRVWNLETGEDFSLDAGDGIGVWQLRMVADGRLLVAQSFDDERSEPLSLWDLDTRRQERLFDGEAIMWGVQPQHQLAVSGDGRFVLGVQDPQGEGSLYLADLVNRSHRKLDGFKAFFMDLGVSGTTAVTWGRGAFFQVGPVTSKLSRLVPSPIGWEAMGFLSLSPDAKRLAVGYGDGSIWLHPVPDLDNSPLHNLPRDAFLARLETFTNVRAVRDPESETGWKLDAGPFPGWETEPEW